MAVTYWPKEQQVRPEDDHRPLSPWIRFIGREETDDELVEYFKQDPLPEFILAPHAAECKESSTYGWTIQHILSRVDVGRDSCDIGVWFCGATRSERGQFYEHCLDNDYCMIIPPQLVVEGGRVWDRRRLLVDLSRYIRMEPGIFILPSFDPEEEWDARAMEVINELDGDWEVLL